MKCIKDKRTKVIYRVNDHVARSLVHSGKYQYCPKQEWKQSRGGK